MTKLKVYYDGLSRVIKTEDSQGNQALAEYDTNSNLIKTIVVEKHDSARIPSETFVTWNVYDSLNRLVRTTDNIGQTRRITYDSRNLAIKITDAQGALISDPKGLYSGNINSDGNASHIIHDGLGRALRTIRELRVNGEGNQAIDTSNSTNPDGKIIESNVWDNNSRIVSVTDDKGNTTSYQYDNLNRATITTFADGKTTKAEYDKDSNVIRYTDQIGNIITTSYDSLHRPIAIDIQKASGVIGTTRQTFEYDGLSRLLKATDNNDPTNIDDDSVIERKYDSLGRTLEESQNGKVISYNWIQSSELVDLTYPNGQKIKYQFDKLNRLTSISREGVTTPVVSYDYIGSRIIERVYGNGTKLTMLNDAGDTTDGYDELGRLSQMRHTKNGVLIAGYRYGYNRENIKLYQENLTHSHLSELYQYDSVYRLVDFKRGTLNATKDALVDIPSQTQNWQLDGVGNWAATTVDNATKTQTVDNMNEYDSFDGQTQIHDDNGNLTAPGDDRSFIYDFANRLVEVRNTIDNSIIAQYRYDALGRRIYKSFTKEIEDPNTEYISDENTIALYHFNKTSGSIIDDSGNDNHGRISKNRIQRGIEGLYDTFAAKFKGTPVIVRKSKSLNNLQNEITVESWIYIENDKNRHDDDDDDDDHDDDDDDDDHDDDDDDDDHEKRGNLLHKPSSYKLSIDKKSTKALFTLYIKDKAKHNHEKKEHDRNNDDDDEHSRKRKMTVQSNLALPVDTWIHVAGVYNGKEIKLFIDGEAQNDIKFITGNIHLSNSGLKIGDNDFQGTLEEARISNIARSEFSGSGTKTIMVKIVRTFFYSGWQVLEEREQSGEQGKPLTAEKVTRQFRAYPKNTNQYKSFYNSYLTRDP